MNNRVISVKNILAPSHSPGMELYAVGKEIEWALCPFIVFSA